MIKKSLYIADSKGSFDNEIINYINTTFNVDKQTIILLEAMFKYMDSNSVTFETTNINNTEYYIKSCIIDFISIVNNADIDLTIEELYRNNVLYER